MTCERLDFEVLRTGYRAKGDSEVILAGVGLRACTWLGWPFSE